MARNLAAQNCFYPEKKKGYSERMVLRMKLKIKIDFPIEMRTTAETHGRILEEFRRPCNLLPFSTEAILFSLLN